MRIRIFISGLLFLIPLSLFSQVKPGYVITLDNDTLTGFIRKGDRIINPEVCLLYTLGDPE